MTGESRRRQGGAVLAAAALFVGLSVPSWAADPQDRKRQVEQQLENQRADVAHSTKEFAEATAAWEAAQAKLPAAEQAVADAEQAVAKAQGELATAQQKVIDAQAADAKAADDLAAAEQAVVDQHEKIRVVTDRIEQQRGSMSNVASRAYRTGSGSDLMNMATVFQSENLGDAAVGVAYTQSVMTAQGHILTGFRTDRVELANERVVLEGLEAEAAELKAAAEEHLAETERLQAAAEQARDAAEARQAESLAAKAEVENLAAARDAAKARAEAAKEADRRQYDALVAEREKINAEIREIARKEREAQERREREERARKQRQEEQERKERQERQNRSDRTNQRSEPKPQPKPQPRRDPEPKRQSTSSTLGWPVSNPYVTSPYGMRVHPITGIYKLHDGTDFRAYCGVPIRAVASGTVQWASYRGGYGNQVAVSHGSINGRGTISSYSHLSRFAVGSGSSVSKGQIIGYSGTTGSSTACHLHFMLYRDGSLVNPMNHLG